MELLNLSGFISQIILKVFNEYDILGGQLLSQLPSSSEDQFILPTLRKEFTLLDTPPSKHEVRLLSFFVLYS